MLINDAYKAYIIEETDHSFMIEKNNDKQYYEVLRSYKYTIKRRILRVKSSFC